MWTRNLQPLAAHGLRVIAPDLPGFGGTRQPAGPLGRLSQALRSGVSWTLWTSPRASLIGHSQSGRVAVDLAFEAPQRFAKVVVLGTGSLLPPLPGNSESAAEGEEGATSEPTLDESRRLLESNLYHRHLATEDAVALRHRMSLGKNFEAFTARAGARAAPRPTRAARRRGSGSPGARCRCCFSMERTTAVRPRAARRSRGSSVRTSTCGFFRAAPTSSSGTRPTRSPSSPDDFWWGISPTHWGICPTARAGRTPGSL